MRIVNDDYVDASITQRSDQFIEFTQRRNLLLCRIRVSLCLETIRRRCQRIALKPDRANHHYRRSEL